MVLGLDLQPSTRAIPQTIDRHAIADALAGKGDPRVQDFRKDLQAQLASVSHDITALHDAVHSVAVKYFPKRHR